jgi:hypothetical protein
MVNNVPIRRTANPCSHIRQLDNTHRNEHLKDDRARMCTNGERRRWSSCKHAHVVSQSVGNGGDRLTVDEDVGLAVGAIRSNSRSTCSISVDTLSVVCCPSHDMFPMRQRAATVDCRLSIVDCRTHAGAVGGDDVTPLCLILCAMLVVLPSWYQHLLDNKYIES